MALDSFPTFTPGQNAGDPGTITRRTGSWIDDGFTADSYIQVVNTTNNDGFWHVTAVTASTLTLDPVKAPTAEAGNSDVTIDGVFLNEGDPALTFAGQTHHPHHGQLDRRRLRGRPDGDHPEQRRRHRSQRQRLERARGHRHHAHPGHRGHPVRGAERRHRHHRLRQGQPRRSAAGRDRPGALADRQLGRADVRRRRSNQRHHHPRHRGLGHPGLRGRPAAPGRLAAAPTAAATGSPASVAANSPSRPTPRSAPNPSAASR